jgi:outer membrane protein assembly factor BamB
MGRHLAYAVSAEGTLHCVQLEDGRPLWRRALYEEYDLPLGAFAVAASPLLEGHRLIFNLGAAERDAGVIALHEATGTTLWTSTDHRASCATPVPATIHGRRYVFVMTFEGLVALDPATGRRYWTVEHRPKAPDSINATSPLVLGDRVIAVTGPGPGAVCVRVLPDGGHEEVWRDRSVLDSQFNNLVGIGDYFFGYSARRQGGATFRCVRADDGKLCWKWSSSLDRGCVLAVDGHFLLWGEHGHLASLEVDFTEPRVRALTSEPLLETPCYSSPALNNGLLYVRNEARLTCFDLRGGGRESDKVTASRPSAADLVRLRQPTR